MKKVFLFLVGFTCQGWVVKAQPSSPTVWEERSNERFVVRSEIPAFTQTTVDYQRKGKTVFRLQLAEPSVISVASKPERWGHFQFPDIARTQNGAIAAKWNMAEDAMEAYGNNATPSAVSVDGGKTWKPNPKPWDESETNEGVLLPNGDQIKIMTPKPIKTDELQLPKSVGNADLGYGTDAQILYKLTELPASRQGVFLARRKKGEHVWKDEQATLDDPQALRYSLRGMLPVVWWGDLKVAADGSVVAGVYPGFYLKKDGTPDPKSATFFYRSTDQGHSWKILGRIPYQADVKIDTSGNRHQGFTEPAFEILADGTYLCVLRTTDRLNGPMYASRSTDQGKTWSKPEVITASGVLPKLLQLKNGITVVAAGRPGVQVRFSNDGKGKVWTNGFEMLPFEINNKGMADQVSCGYTGLLETGPDKFLVIYSDFLFKNAQGETRKAIKVREITVSPL
jgi:hypothetical protein